MKFRFKLDEVVKMKNFIKFLKYNGWSWINKIFKMVFKAQEHENGLGLLVFFSTPNLFLTRRIFIQAVSQRETLRGA